MGKKKIDIKKIKERNVSEEEIKQNEKQSKIKNYLLYKIPIIIEIILVLFYVPTANNILLIPISIIFVIILYGIDCHQRICSNCKKWNSTVTLKDDRFLRTTKVEKQNLLGKNKIKKKKNIVNKIQTKCLNCGHVTEKEVIK